nr:replication protein A 70 kDa DNA-binding subunit E-like [Ipomoea batatas]
MAKASSSSDGTFPYSLILIKENELRKWQDCPAAQLQCLCALIWKISSTLSLCRMFAVNSRVRSTHGAALSAGFAIVSAHWCVPFSAREALLYDSSHHSSAASYEDLHAQQLEEELQSTAFNEYEHDLRSIFKPRYRLIVELFDGTDRIQATMFNRLVDKLFSLTETENEKDSFDFQKLQKKLDTPTFSVELRCQTQDRGGMTSVYTISSICEDISTSSITGTKKKLAFGESSNPVEDSTNLPPSNVDNNYAREKRPRIE